MKALVFNGRVVEITEKEFPVHNSMEWKDCDETVATGDFYEDGVFLKPEARDNRTYAEKRASEYPPISDQLDALWKEIERITSGEVRHPEAQAMLDKITNVKNKYPKGRE